MTSAAVALVIGLLGAGSHELAAKLSGPSQLAAGKPFVLTVEIMNGSSKSYLYRQHWAWASNTMSLEATGLDGAVTRSDPLLSHIDARAECLYTKPLGPHERFTFEVPVNRSPVATLQLRFPRPGRYQLACLYEFAAEPADTGHRCFEVPFWEGKLQSNALTLEVTR